MDTAQNGMLYAFQKCKHQLFSSTRLISIKFSNVSGLFGAPCIIIPYLGKTHGGTRASFNTECCQESIWEFYDLLKTEISAISKKLSRSSGLIEKQK